MGTYNTICACAPDDTNARTADSDSQQNTEQLIQTPKKLRNLTADRKTHVLLILTSCNVLNFNTRFILSVWRVCMVSFVLHTIKYCSYIGNFSYGQSCVSSLLLPRILQYFIVFYNNYKLQYFLFLSVAYFRVSILKTTKELYSSLHSIYWIFFTCIAFKKTSGCYSSHVTVTFCINVWSIN